MKYLALVFTGFGLIAAYKGWVFQGFEFFVSLRQNKPLAVQEAEQFSQDGNIFTITLNSSNKVVVEFADKPKGMKTLKILGLRYKEINSEEFMEL